MSHYDHQQIPPAAGRRTRRSRSISVLTRHYEIPASTTWTTARADQSGARIHTYPYITEGGEEKHLGYLQGQGAVDGAAHARWLWTKDYIPSDP
eukprot:626515-Pyramimonas_sp.AAC.1